MSDEAKKLSALSGCVWALIAYFIGHRAFGGNIWGGIVAAPLIGILIGYLGRSMQNKPVPVQSIASLFLLYGAATCFAIATAVFGSQRVTPSAILMQNVWAVLWGLTFTGYVFALWPLAFFNQRLIGQVDAGRIEALHTRRPHAGS